MKINQQSLKTFEKFKEDEIKLSDVASKKLLNIVTGKKLTLEDVRQKMFEKTGMKISEPTFLKWVHDPYHMNIYELKALSKTLSIKSDLFINIVFGWVKVEVLTNIDAVPAAKA